MYRLESLRANVHIIRLSLHVAALYGEYAKIPHNRLNLDNFSPKATFETGISTS